MLIDERTIGQAEHAGLFLEAANKTAFIGSPSAGADGEVNELRCARRRHDFVSPAMTSARRTAANSNAWACSPLFPFHLRLKA